MSILSRLVNLAVGAAEREGAETAARRVAANSPEAQARRLAVKRAATEVQPLPAPPRPLALPKPAPKSAGKPRGGQFYPDVKLGVRDAQAAGYKVHDRGEYAHPATRYQVVRPTGEAVNSYHGPTPEHAWKLADSYHRINAPSRNLSPEAAARASREDAGLVDYTPDQSDLATPLGNWLERALTKYYKTDFGTEADPLRDLAARGLHYDPEMTPARWVDEANSSLMEDPIGHFTVPRHASEIATEHNPPAFSNDGEGDLADIAHHLAPSLSYFGNADPVAQGALMQAAPWLRKQPATDMLYGIRSPLELGHFADEMKNALMAQHVGLPPELAVRPESLQRMSFPQAAEHVGKINQWRVKQMEADRAAALNNPALAVHKEYPDAGMRWVELRAPDMPEGYHLDPATGEVMTQYGSNGPAGGAGDPRRPHLEEALKAEGDIMGHCVGGYCPDVMAGRSRIFSLRDAKGMPHVTIETAPKDQSGSFVPPEVYDRALQQSQQEFGVGNWEKLDPRIQQLIDQWREEQRAAPPIQNIVQIKGKQNRAPNPEYLPYVQDFVKSGQWGDIGDLRNTQLTKLPDGRYITEDQWREGAAKMLREANPAWEDNWLQEQLQRNYPRVENNPHTIADRWDAISKHFEGYKRGGLAVKRPCGCASCNERRAA